MSETTATITWHLIDEAGNYLGPQQHVPGRPVPRPVAPEAPPPEPPGAPGPYPVWVPGTGWEYRDAPAVRLPEPDPVPETISRFQARAALMQADLLATVEAAVAEADPLTQLAWAEAVEWQRSSPTINALGAALGLTEAQIDDLFRAAAAIQAR